ncbi:Serine/threonine-protein kinase 33 [Irineochytrium annulatum]|nr:Serine/threonine-protein kinase 33 [Irineochytrium annulatum]
MGVAPATRPHSSAGLLTFESDVAARPPTAPPPQRRPSTAHGLLASSPAHAHASHQPLEADEDVTGSTDLSGEKKERIEHHRVDDRVVMDARYALGRKLGQGSFGTVRLVRHKETMEDFACKVLRKVKGNQTGYELMHREVSIMKKVRHPHIVQLKEVFETPKKIYMIMEK